MSEIKIHVFHTGKVCVSPNLPFGGENCSPLKASGIFGKKEDRLWLPVSAYLIEHPKGLFLVDTGWSRAMSPAGEFDAKAQIESLGSRRLYLVNQGHVPLGMCIDEQLEAAGFAVSDISAVLLTHLDCDHANGLAQVKDAKRFIVSADELRSAGKARNRLRFNKDWWGCVELEAVEWNDAQGPFGKSYDLLGDGSIQLVNIPGHSDGLFAVKASNSEGKFVLLCSDGGYARKSWEDMIVSGVAVDRAQQKVSLEWIRQQSLDPLCVELLANHDPAVNPHVIEL